MKRRDDKLTDTFRAEHNLLGVPLFALNPRSAAAERRISMTWNVDGAELKFTFSRVGDTPFPLAQHAKILDCLLGMLKNNFRDDGVVFFKTSDIAKQLGLKSSGGLRESIVEAINRYQKTHVEWVSSFDGIESSWTSSIIEVTEAKNPRNSSRAEDCRSVAFSHMIVESLSSNKARIMMNESLRLPAYSYIVYRWLKRSTDRPRIHRTFDAAQQALNCRLRRSRFKEWLERNLAILMREGFVEAYDFEKKSFSVKLAVDKKSN